MSEGTVRLARGGTALDIDLDRGGRAIAWTVDGLALLRPAADASIDFGMYPMAPWAGRLRGNRVHGDHQHGDGTDGHELSANHGPWAIHGTLLDARTTPVAADGDEQVDRLVVESRQDPGPRWPWPMRAVVAWEVRSDRVRSRIEVQAVDEPFPAVLGWHPWFARRLERGADAVWEMAADVMAVRGDDHLPTGELVPANTDAGPFDDAFRVPDGSASIRWPGALSLRVSSAPWFVVYDEQPDWVCLEPQSGPPDGINDGLGEPITWVTPETPAVLDVTWTITREA